MTAFCMRSSYYYYCYCYCYYYYYYYYYTIPRNVGCNIFNKKGNWPRVNRKYLQEKSNVIGVANGTRSEHVAASGVLVDCCGVHNLIWLKLKLAACCVLDDRG